jgi:hypothetical protein
VQGTRQKADHACLCVSGVSCRLPSAKPFVLAQRYVADPLLIDGCKFGIRLWLLITGVEPFTAYIHNQGLVLFSTDRCVCCAGRLWAHTRAHTACRTRMQCVPHQH